MAWFTPGTNLILIMRNSLAYSHYQLLVNSLFGVVLIALAVAIAILSAD